MTSFKLQHLIIAMIIVAAFCGGWAGGFIYSDSRFPSDPTLRDPAFANKADQVVYDPVTFEKQLGDLIENGNYSTAIVLLDICPVDEQIQHQQLKNGGTASYMGVAGYSITLPGTNQYFDPDRDRVLQETGSGFASKLWRASACRFAQRYNRRVDALNAGGK